MAEDGRVVIRVEADPTSFEAAMAAVVSAADAAMTQISRCAAEATGALTLAAHEAEATAQTVVDLFGDTLSGPMASGRMKSAAGALMGFLTDAITGELPGLISVSTRAAEEAASAFSLPDWHGVGVNMVAGMTMGVRSATGGLVQAAVTAASSALSAAKQFLGIASPSRRARDEIGVEIPRGIALGVADGGSELDVAVRSELGRIMERLRAAVLSEVSAVRAPNVSVAATAGDVAAALGDTLAADRRGTHIGIEFTGSLAQLGRVLHPVVKYEDARLGTTLVTE